jgi:hypothetical protein
MAQKINREIIFNISNLFEANYVKNNGRQFPMHILEPTILDVTLFIGASIFAVTNSLNSFYFNLLIKN